MVPDTEIRVIVNTSGAEAAAGKHFLDGAKLAAEDVRKALPNVRMTERNDQCDPQVAVSLAAEALKDGVAAVIGHGCGLTAGAASAAYRSKTLFLSSSSSATGGTPSVAELRFGLSPTFAMLQAYGKRLLVNGNQEANAIACEVSREPGGRTTVTARTSLAGKPSDTSTCELPALDEGSTNPKVKDLSKRLGYIATTETLRGYSALWAISASLHLAASDPKRKVAEVLASEAFFTGFGKFSFGRAGMMSPALLLSAAPTAANTDPIKVFKSSHSYASGDDLSVRGGVCRRLSCEAANSCLSDGKLSKCNPAAICHFQCF